MAGFWYKNATNQWSKIKNIYYKSATNTWSKAKGGRYKYATNSITPNLLQDIQTYYTSGNVTGTRETEGFVASALNNVGAGSEIGVAFNASIEVTNYTQIRFTYDVALTGSVAGGVVCSIFTQEGGNKDQFTARTENISSGNNLVTNVSVNAYTGNYFARLHVYQNATSVTTARRVATLKSIVGVASNGALTTIWGA